MSWDEKAIAKRSEVLFCDEPTGELDFQTGKQMLEVIHHANREFGTAVEVIIHDFGIVVIAARAILL